MHACLPQMFENDTDGTKLAWRLRELLTREAAGQLRPAEQRHPAYKGTFDHNAAAFELETTRGSAFDPVVEPAVVPLEVWEISHHLRGIIGTAGQCFHSAGSADLLRYH